MKLTTRLDRLEALRPRAKPSTRPLAFDHEAYKAAYDAAVAERGIDAVLDALLAMFTAELAHEVAP